MTPSNHRWIEVAQAEGTLPKEVWPALAERVTAPQRPWPVVLLTGLGAWLAALPLMAMVGLMLSDTLQEAVGALVVGSCFLVVAVIVLRAQNMPLFGEQMAVPALLAGAGLLVYGVSAESGPRSGAIVMAVVSLGVAWRVPQAWLRVWLGAGAVLGLMLAALLEPGSSVSFQQSWLRPGLILQGLAVVSVVVMMALDRGLFVGRVVALAAVFESIMVGWTLAVIAGLTLLSGMTFLMGGVAGWSTTMLGHHGGGSSVASSVWALCALAWLLHRWPVLRRPWCVAAGLVLAGLSYVMPSLGAIWGLMAVLVTSHRWRVAVAAGLAATWILGAFYYALAWPLATKAVVLVGAGTAMGALAWWAHRDGAGASEKTERLSAANPRPRAGVSGAAAGLMFSAVVVLCVANVGIWQKERLIAQGQPIFVALMPMDPRSLMQGDFMALNFQSRQEILGSDDAALGFEHPRVVMKRDARGVATLQRPDKGQALAVDELVIQLVPKHGRWILVTDAFFFKEGEGARWAKARFGEFRVDAAGRALLVGLRDEHLAPL